MKDVSGQMVRCCVYENPKNGIIPHMFDCWADPVVHLLLLKSCMYLLAREREQVQVSMEVCVK